MSAVVEGEKEYGAVPPVVLNVTLPLLPPKQLTSDFVKVADKAAGWVMVAGTVVEQLFESVTVNVYDPGARPVCTGVILYGAVPPDAVIVTLPFKLPKQLTFDCEVMVAVN